jgi:multicomponent Na+:H+ antiporter subunit F
MPGRPEWDIAAPVGAPLFSRCKSSVRSVEAPVPASPVASERMDPLVPAVALLFVAGLAGGLVRIVRGPTREDRMLAALLFGTTGVAVLLLLAETTGDASLRDVALVFSVLATVNAAVFVRHGRRRPGASR